MTGRDRFRCTMPDPATDGGSLEWTLPYSWDKALAWRFVETMRREYGEASLVIQRTEVIVK